MNKIIAILFLLSTLHIFSQQNDWENPTVNQINKLPARATFYSYESADLAKKNIRKNSKLFKSLNGDWKFNWVAKPVDASEVFQENDFDATKWKTIDVPFFLAIFLI